MASPQGPRPPGWYDDPNLSGQPRWWDGNNWAPPMGAPPGMYGGYAPMNPINLPEEKSTGERAATALWAGVGVQAIVMITNVVVFSEMADAISKALSSTSSRPRGTAADPMANLSATATTANAIGQVASLGGLVVGILFLLWFHRALTNAQALGLPMRRSPGWGVVGFFIPIANLWFPYQSGCDLFPPGHPDRKLVGRWWAFYLGAGFVAVAAMTSSLFSIAVGAAIAVVVIGMYFQAAVCARQMIARAFEVHRELAEQAGLAGPGPMGGPGAGPGPGMGGAGPGSMGPGAMPLGPGGPGAARGAPPDPWNPTPPRDPWASS